MLNTSQYIVHVHLTLFQYIWISIQLLSLNRATNKQTNQFISCILSFKQHNRRQRLSALSDRAKFIFTRIHFTESCQNYLLGFHGLILTNKEL